MRRFDSEAIKARLLERLRIKTDWALISGDGTVSAVLDVFADSEAELARYMEYLLAEKKWSTAQNISSLITQTDLIGSKTKRKRSATGYVIVSHTDSTGANRLGNYGRSFFNVDERSDYDDIVQTPEEAGTLKTQALVPWTAPRSYVIPKGTRFISTSGVEFVSTETKAIRALTTPYSFIEANATLRDEFLRNGGWNGIKYLKIPVIQGIQKTQEFTPTYQSFETFLLPTSYCEDASNSVSKDFLQFEVVVAGASEYWIQIPNIALAGPYDKVFEVINMPDYSGVLFKVGNGVTGKLLPESCQVIVHYLETLGSAGNISSKYQINSINFGTATILDPRFAGASSSSFLSTTNIVSILGGQNEQTEEDIRREAPLDYLKYYSIATTAAYETQIKAYSQIGLNKVKVYPGVVTDAIPITDDVLAPHVQTTLYVTAVTSDGTTIDDPENQFIKPVTKAISDLKAPSDSISYIEPNFIKIRLNSIIYSDDVRITTDEATAIIKQALLDKYSIFYRGFKESLYSSDVISTVKSFPFVTRTHSYIEAVADVDFSPSTEVNVGLGISKIQTAGYPILYKIKFKFDKIYGRNLYEQGFYNYLQSAPYVVRIDLKFKTDASKNRTFFLYDDRYLFNAGSMPSLETGKYTTLQGTSVVTNGNAGEYRRPEEKVDPEIIEIPGQSQVRMFNRAVRVAQFPLLSSFVTDTRAMISKVKSPSQEPQEIRPWETDAFGNGQIYSTSAVDSADRLYRNPGSMSAAQCYKKDARYIDYADIQFTEEYATPEALTYAAGALILPANYFEDFSYKEKEDVTSFSSALKNYVTMKVYARPLASDFFPSEWNEIMFADEDDIVVEKLSNAEY